MNVAPDRYQAQDWLRRQVKSVAPRTGLGDREKAVAEAVQVEAWLQENGVEYAPATGIPMGMIDTKRSRANQARRDPLVQDSVDRYCLAFKQGSQFPPIVVYPVGNKLVIIDGNNRHAGATKAGVQYIQGIVISEKTPSETIHLLTVSANANHGVTPPQEWRIKQAIGLLEAGFTMERAAQAANLSAQAVRNARSAQEADNRARHLKIFGFTDIPATSKTVLNALKDDPIFKAAAILAVGKKFSIDQVRDLCRDVKAARSEADRLAVIARASSDVDSERAAKGAAKKIVPPSQRVLAGAGIFNSLAPAELVASIRTVHDRDLVNQRLEEAQNTILEMQVAMEALKDMEEA